jgi:hypothetical protein
MAEDSKIDTNETPMKSRRQVVTTAAQVAVTAPAASILLASVKPAAAQISPYQATQLHILDDFTFGNNEEDIDALEQQSNFNPFNGQANQDDVWNPPA